MYQYKAKVTKVVDGDTVYVEADLGFFIKTHLKLRLAGINAPEIRGEERPKGLEATEYLKKLLGDREVIIETEKTGKYGRWIAKIYLEEVPETPMTLEFERLNGKLHVDVNTSLVAAGHAVEVDYGS